jgi:hypothetical protein
MLKASIALIAICAGILLAAFLVKSDVNPTKTPIAELTMPSLEELHARAHVENLSVQEVKEPF